MSPWSQIIREIAFRKWNALLMFTGLAAVAATISMGKLIAEADERETRRVTRDMGFNLRIIPAETDLGQFYRDGYSRRMMDASLLDRLATSLTNNVEFNHLVGTLRHEYTINGETMMLVGLSETYVAPGQGKKPMGFKIKPGTVHIGSEIARALKKKKGDKFHVGTASYEIVNDAIETGTQDDITVFMRLEDAQATMQLAGKINEIEAIDCLCLTADQDPLSILRKTIGEILPGVQVVQKRVQADARAKQRQTRERVNQFVLPTVLLTGALWVAVLFVINVRDRRQEIGVLRAIGKRGGQIAGLFLGKAILLGLAASVAGALLGTWLGLQFGPELFPVTKNAIKPNWNLVSQLAVAMPVFAALVAFIPTTLAVSQDPAASLRED